MKRDSGTPRQNLQSFGCNASWRSKKWTALMVGVAMLTVSIGAGASPQNETASSVTVFGLPIGGVLKPAPRACNLGQISTGTTKVICWLEKPTATEDGRKIGILHLPNPEGRPEWAAYAEFSAIVSKGGVLDWVRVQAQNEGKKHLIADSISKRFGYPVQAPLPDNFSYATWRSEGVQIDQVCDYLTCRVSFRPALTPAQQAQADATYEVSERRRAGRPISP